MAKVASADRDRHEAEDDCERHGLRQHGGHGRHHDHDEKQEKARQAKINGKEITDDQRPAGAEQRLREDKAPAPILHLLGRVERRREEPASRGDHHGEADENGDHPAKHDGGLDPIDGDRRDRAEQDHLQRHGADLRLRKLAKQLDVEGMAEAGGRGDALAHRTHLMGKAAAGRERLAVQPPALLNLFGGQVTHGTRNSKLDMKTWFFRSLHFRVKTLMSRSQGWRHSLIFLLLGGVAQPSGAALSRLR